MKSSVKTKDLFDTIHSKDSKTELIISEYTDHIFKHLFKVKKELDGVIKNSTNPFYTSSYADLNEHLQTVEPILHKYGMMLLQPNIASLKGNCVTALIIHVESGQYIGSSMILPKVADAQKAIAAVTYFRRANINSLLALKSLDDDGNTASGKSTFKKSKKKNRSSVEDEY